MCMGVPPGVLGCPALPPPALPCPLHPLPAAPPGLGTPGTPQDPLAGSRCPGDTAWAWGAVLSPLTGASTARGSCWAGTARAPSEPPQALGGPWGPPEVWVLWGSPWLHSHPPWGRAGAPGGSYGVRPKTPGSSCSPPGHGPAVPSPGCPGSVPVSSGSPSPGVPCPAGVPSPRGGGGHGPDLLTRILSLSPLSNLALTFSPLGNARSW